MIDAAVMIERWAMKDVFATSRNAITEIPVLLLTLTDPAGRRGRAEAAGVDYAGETPQSMASEIAAVAGSLHDAITRAELGRLLPPGGARNALDCALWELDAQRTARPVWRLAGLPPPRPLTTTFTLGAEAPEVMAEGARRHGGARALKVKLTGDIALDRARVAAVRAVRPDVWLGVDANQAYAVAQVPELIDMLRAARVELLEQPVARGQEAGLENIISEIPIAADESVLTLADLPGLVGRFDVVNIKLDKCGGLTEGLTMAYAAHRLGLKVMVGNMMGSSLAMAPAFVLGQLCEVVDLDGPTFLAQDRTPGVRYVDGQISCAEAVWGGPTPVRSSNVVAL